MMNGQLPSLEQLKDQAKRMRTAFSKNGRTINHGEALEIIARQHGFRDWNTLYAARGNRPADLKLKPGDKVRGTYLGRPFKAAVIGVHAQSAHNRLRVTLHFDEPVDVVKFDSFSSFRQRVTCTLNAEGQTGERTSDGRPQLQLDTVNASQYELSQCNLCI